MLLGNDDSIAAMLMLREALGEAMEGAGLGRWTRHPYTPHITLLYADRPITEQRVERIGWTVGELVLIHSRLDRHRHHMLGRWQLRAPEAQAPPRREP